MHETSKLMARVMASVMILGPAGVAPTSFLSGLQQQNPKQTRPENPAKKALDEETRDTVLSQLACQKESAKPKSVDMLVTELPKIDRKTIEAAIKSQLDDGEIVRLGDGTKKSPYRYFRAVGCGG